MNTYTAITKRLSALGAPVDDTIDLINWLVIPDNGVAAHRAVLAIPGVGTKTWCDYLSSLGLCAEARIVPQTLLRRCHVGEDTSELEPDIVARGSLAEMQDELRRANDPRLFLE